MTIWVVILLSMLIGAIYTIVNLNAPVSKEEKVNTVRSGISKY